MGRSRDHITVGARCLARKSIRLLGFAATTFPFWAPAGVTTAGKVEKPQGALTLCGLDQSRASQANRVNCRWIKVVLRDFVFCYLRVSQLSGCFFGVTFPKLEDFLAFFCRLRRVRLPLMYSFSVLVSALHPPRWLRNHRRMNGSVLPRSHSLPPGWEGVTARLAPSPIPKSLPLTGLSD